VAHDQHLYREFLARLPPHSSIAVEASGSYSWLIVATANSIFFLMGVMAADKTRRVALTQESNPGLADQGQAQICTGMHTGGLSQRSEGELCRIVQAARRS